MKIDLIRSISFFYLEESQCLEITVESHLLRAQILSSSCSQFVEQEIDLFADEQTQYCQHKRRQECCFVSYSRTHVKFPENLDFAECFSAFAVIELRIFAIHIRLYSASVYDHFFDTYLTFS